MIRLEGVCNALFTIRQFVKHRHIFKQFQIIF